jgi:hypothetical protein
MEPTKLSSKARKAIERIRVLRKSLPVSMLATAEKRVYTELSVADASDAALFLYEEDHRAAHTQEAQ